MASNLQRLVPRAVRYYGLRTLASGRGNRQGTSSNHRHNLGLPNMLTTARIALSPAVGWLTTTEYPGVALAGVTVLAATDFLDGYLARRWKMQTAVGAVLDPVADKVMVNSIFVGLATQQVVPWWLCGLVAGRDLLLLGGGVVLRLKNIREPTPRKLFNPDFEPVKVNVQTISKVNTALQLLLAFYGTVCLVDDDLRDQRVLDGMIACVAGSTLLSGGRYLYLSVTQKMYSRL